MERLYNQLDRIEGVVGKITPELASIRTDLNYHIKRVDILEAQFILAQKSLTRLQGFFSIAGWLLGIAATLVTLALKLKGLL